VSPFQRLLWTRIWLVNHRTLGLLSLPEAERLAAVDDLIRAAASGEDCRAREGLLQGLPRAPGATDPWTPADVDRWLGREEQAWHAASDARAIERPPRELAEQLAGLWIRAEQPGSGLVLPKPALRSVDSFAVTAEGGLQLLVCQVFPRFWLHLKTGPAAERDEFARAVLWASADTQMDEVLVPVDTPEGQPRVDGDDYPHAARVLWLTGEVRVKVVLDAEDRPVRASVVARPAPPVWLRGDAPVVLDRLFDSASIKRAMHQPYARRPAGAAAGERSVLIAYQWRLAD
jgi:hypothetical protein